VRSSAVEENRQVASIEPEGVISWGTGPAVALSFSVNFGVFAGREVSGVELERLGKTLLGLVEGVSVTAESHYEFAKGSAANLHQVRVDIDHDALPPGEPDIEQLRARIAEALAAWLRYCLTGVSGKELTHAELVARDAVLEAILHEPEPPATPSP
jgi:hypothetical protein